MELVVNAAPRCTIHVSFVLLDWSCRESLHTLDYLNDQTVARDQYEILWIEYYDRRLPDLERRIAEAKAAQGPPPVDIYAVMGMPRSAYYHKHLMYNAGILLAHGRIICFCDSDAFMRRTFVESIVHEFHKDPDIVLHMDEIRNNSRHFYPFHFPSFSDVVGPGCPSWVNGRPLGLLDRADPLHTRNYGACMCANRDDLIAIGGADMHRDYLGHICGPYEMTFRLLNAGKREVWHPSEWLYHVWHPGQAGDRNFAGPHDGKHMSTTALAALTSGRIQPLTPHPAVAIRRNGNLGRAVSLDEMVEPAWLREWDVSGVTTKSRSYFLGRHKIALIERPPAHSPNPAIESPPSSSVVDRRLGKFARMMMAPLIVGLLFRQFKVKIQAAHLRQPRSGAVAAAYEPLRKLRAAMGFLGRMLDFNRHRIRTCWLNLAYVASLGQTEVVLYGDGEAARILSALAMWLPIRVRAICPFHGSPRPDKNGWSEERLRRYGGTVVVASFVNSAAHVSRLERLGFNRERLVVLE